jgi:hypothetical protein
MEGRLPCVGRLRLADRMKIDYVPCSAKRMELFMRGEGQGPPALSPLPPHLSDYFLEKAQDIIAA